MDQFEASRASWFMATYGSVAEALDLLSPEIAAMIPDDLGPKRLVAATVLAQLAQMDTQGQTPETAADFLERLSGGMAYQGERPFAAVLELWGALRQPTISLLHAWWRVPLGEGLLAFWAERRAAATGWARVHAELRERWSIDTDQIWRRNLSGAEEAIHWCGFFEALDANVADPNHARLGRALLTGFDGLEEEIEQMASERGAALAHAPHLDHIHRMRCLATGIGEVARLNADGLGSVGLSPEERDLKAALTDIHRVAELYSDWVHKTFIPGLTALERALLDLGGAEAQKADAYLDAFAEVMCGPAMGAPDTPVFGEVDFAGLAPHERPDVPAPRWMALAADALAGSPYGAAMDAASQPWWVFAVEAGLMSAAALEFKNDGAVRIGCIDAESVHEPIVRFPAGHPYERTLAMCFRYDEDDPLSMCHLLALSRTKRARLAFLAQGRGGWKVLRLVGIPVQDELAAMMGRKAIAELDRLTGRSPERLRLHLEDLVGSHAAKGRKQKDKQQRAPEPAESVDGALFPLPDALF
ncbi:hypothetical protein ABZ615_30670 [Streptomyces sp. NPDC007325]|uniref:hypothetical protein n=1 Tax=Streptomyces sp. NPDC007325 TaxID=3154588 RepID=UPI0033F675AF